MILLHWWIGKSVWFSYDQICCDVYRWREKLEAVLLQEDRSISRWEVSWVSIPEWKPISASFLEDRYSMNLTDFPVIGLWTLDNALKMRDVENMLWTNCSVPVCDCPFCHMGSLEAPPMPCHPIAGSAFRTCIPIPCSKLVGASERGKRTARSFRLSLLACYCKERTKRAMGTAFHCYAETKCTHGLQGSKAVEER